MLPTTDQSIHSSVYPWSFSNLWALCTLAHALSDDCISGPSQNLRVKNSHFVFNSHARTWGLTYIPARTSLSKQIWQSRPWSNYFENRAVFTVNICLICKCSSHTVINDMYYPALIKSASAELSTVTPLDYFENISVFTVKFCLICKCSCHTVINDVYYHAFKSASAELSSISQPLARLHYPAASAFPCTAGSPPTPLRYDAGDSLVERGCTTRTKPEKQETKTI